MTQRRNSMPEAGLEPASPEGRGILSPLSGIQTAPTQAPASSVSALDATIPNPIPSGVSGVYRAPTHLGGCHYVENTDRTILICAFGCGNWLPRAGTSDRTVVVQ